MTVQKINYGTAPDDGTGDPLRVAFKKTDDNFVDLDTRKAEQQDVADALATKVDKVANQRLMTEAEGTKLAGIAAQATKNASDAALRDRSTHTGTQPIATVIGLQTALDTKADSTTVAQAITDAKARANHTGTQPIATVIGLQTALDTKADSTTVAQSITDAKARANHTGPLNWAWATYGGTANTVTLTPAFPRTVYAVGDEFRFRATAKNTGAVTININGLGAKTAVTVTGAALPAGYIRTGVDTVCVYDGTNFVVQREIEYGRNANGDFVRLADGTQLCSYLITGVVASTSTPVSNLYRSNSVPWTYPSAFASLVTVTHSEVSGIGFSWTSLGSKAVELTQTSVTLHTYTLDGTATVSILATGRWY